MHTRFTKVLLMGLVAGGLSSLAQASDSYLDGTAKMRGEFGSMSRGQVNRQMYRAPQQAMNSVAQAPTEERRLSYEPAQKADKAQTENKAPQVAQTETRTTRSFSYDPGTASTNMRVRNRQNSQPMYTLPRTDSRKLGGG